MFHPSRRVTQVLNSYYSQLSEFGIKHPEKSHRSFVGVHIRMLANMTQDTPGLSEEETLRMQLAVAFRVSCHYRFFIKKMLRYPGDTRFFVSTDSPGAFEALSTHPTLRGRVFRLDSHDCKSRGPACMPYAAADLYLLSLSSKLLTSRWSAFSETALRIGGVSSEDGCDEPEGGWALHADKNTLTAQIIEYLEAQHYPSISQVKEALALFS